MTVSTSHWPVAENYDALASRLHYFSRWPLHPLVSHESSLILIISTAWLLVPSAPAHNRDSKLNNKLKWHFLGWNPFFVIYMTNRCADHVLQVTLVVCLQTASSHPHWPLPISMSLRIPLQNYTQECSATIYIRITFKMKKNWLFK